MTAVRVFPPRPGLPERLTPLRSTENCAGRSVARFWTLRHDRICGGDSQCAAANRARLAATNLPQWLPRVLQPPVALRMDLVLPSSENVLRRDLAGGAFQADIVITLCMTLHRAPRIIERQRRFWTDALPFVSWPVVAPAAARIPLERRAGIHLSPTLCPAALCGTSRNRAVRVASHDYLLWAIGAND